MRKIIEFPEGATNGDVFKALFPNYTYVGVCVLDENECILLHDVNYHWWNAPYEAEREDCKDCKQEVKNEPPSAISKEDLSKSFMLGLAFGFGETHDEMDSIKKQIEQTFKPVKEIRAEIEKHCGLIKEDHCKFCSSCHMLMDVREILEILDKHGGKESL